MDGWPHHVHVIGPRPLRGPVLICPPVRAGTEHERRRETDMLGMHVWVDRSTRTIRGILWEYSSASGGYGYLLFALSSYMFSDFACDAVAPSDCESSVGVRVRDGPVGGL